MTRSRIAQFAAAATLGAALAACGGAAADTGSEADPAAPPVAAPHEGGDPIPTQEVPAGGEDPAVPLDDLTGIGVQPEGQELVLRVDDRVEVIGLLPPEGESFYRHATIWPGSTRDALTIVALTQGEGMYDLRWLTYADGQASEVVAFASHHQPLTDLAAAADVAPIPVFSPDGRSLAWLEWNAEGQVQLRTIGWEGGPGTGRTADDNAAFGLDLPAGVQLRTWEAGSGDESYLHAVNDEGRTWTITVQRQGDGALVIGPDAVQEG